MVCVCGRPVRPPIDTSLIYGLMTDEAKHRGQPLVSDVHFNEKGGYSGRLCWANEPCTPHPATGWLRKAYAFNNAPHFATRYLYVHNVLLLPPGPRGPAPRPLRPTAPRAGTACGGAPSRAPGPGTAREKKDLCIYIYILSLIHI